jgi:endonuclease YncB( thermonuclease family)
MATAFFTSGGRARAVAGIRRDSNGIPQPLDTALPDGDTAGVHVDGSGAVRFLGIDTPEKAFDIKGRGRPDLGSEAWNTYLTDPFADEFGLFEIEEPLEAHLRSRAGPDAGSNHRRHAGAAKDALTRLVEGDMQALGQDPASFAYFVAFSFEVFDSNGRFLAFLNRNQPDANVPGPRPLSYNERMLEAGAAMPYFIWPNIDPFRSQELPDAVIAPGMASGVAESTPALQRAREFVRRARQDSRGVFDAADPLRFEAFEIRYIGRREAPNRAVIDLSSDSDVILRPQSYFKVANPEDRLFIPPAFVPLFAARGWRLEGWF